jgi:hypothetical protein
MDWEFVEPADWYGPDTQHIMKADFRGDNVSLDRQMFNTKVGGKYHSFDTLEEAQQAHQR